MTASMEINYHSASDEIDRIFYGNEIHCTEVKHSTSDYYEQLKEYGGRINPKTVPIRFQDMQIDQHSSQRRWPWDGL